MIEMSGIEWAFSESNPKYKRLKNKREKANRKEEEQLIKCIFVDAGKIVTVQIKKKDLSIEVSKHDTLISYRAI
jgi:hypothetical protein